VAERHERTGCDHRRGGSLPPTVAITAPAAGALFQAPASIALTATAASPNSGGSIAKVEFFHGATKIGEALAAPFTFPWAGVVAGDYSLTARRRTTAARRPTRHRSRSRSMARRPCRSRRRPRHGLPRARAGLDCRHGGGRGRHDHEDRGLQRRRQARRVRRFALHGRVERRPAGNHVLTARATDDRGGAATSAGVAIIVGALSGTVGVTPASADIGQDVLFNAQALSRWRRPCRCACASSTAPPAPRCPVGHEREPRGRCPLCLGLLLEHDGPAGGNLPRHARRHAHGRRGDPRGNVAHAALAGRGRDLRGAGAARAVLVLATCHQSSGDTDTPIPPVHCSARLPSARC